MKLHQWGNSNGYHSIYYTENKSIGMFISIQSSSVLLILNKPPEY